MTQPCSITGLKSRESVSGFNESLILIPAPGSGACAIGAAAAGVAVAMASLVCVAHSGFAGINRKKNAPFFVFIGLRKV